MLLFKKCKNVKIFCPRFLRFFQIFGKSKLLGVRFHPQPLHHTGVRRNFSREDNIDILLILFKLLTMQCKRMLTKRCTFSNPKR